MREAMQPFGAALAAWFAGERDAQLIVRRDDGLEVTQPASLFFRETPAFAPIETAALELCSGWVLDAGAGTGVHALVLQQRGLRVTAIDINPETVEIMIRRGVADARCADVFEFQAGPFDTILLLGRAIGMAETIAGLDRFLLHTRRLIAPEGRMLLNSLDVSVSPDPANLAYHESNRQAGRYIGETRMQCEYRGMTGPLCGWLHVDARMLAARAVAAGWDCEVVRTEETGDYLARLEPAG